MSKKNSLILTKIISIFFMLIIALIYLVPFYIVIITALRKTNALATQTPFKWFSPFTDLGLISFKKVFTTYTVFETGKSMILTGFKNTLFVLIPVIIGGMFSSSISAFAFSKMKFKWKKPMFAILLFSMMLPGIVLLIPSYFIYDNLGLTNTFFPIIVPAMFGSATCVFFLRQFYDSVPNELMDAAKVDGLGYFGTYLKIIIPLSKPALIAQALLGVVACYNDYLHPLIYLIDEKKYTLQIALQMFSSGNTNNLNVVMAGSLLSLLPMVVIFFVFQKYFVNGLVMSGMKD